MITTTTQGKRARAGDDVGGDCDAERDTKRITEAPRKIRRIAADSADGPNDRQTAIASEKRVDKLVILRLRESVVLSKQAAVKGWMEVNGLRPISAYKNGRPRGDVRLAEEGEWLWSVRAKGRHRAVVEVGGIFEAKGKGYVGYLRMDRVPRRIVEKEVKGSEEDAEDRTYLGWVVLGLRQLEEKKRERREREKQALSKGEETTDAVKRERESEGEVYLLVVPRGKVSVIRLYTGRVSRRVLFDHGKGDRVGLLRQALTARDPNPTLSGEEGLSGVTLSYEQIDLTKPCAATLFREFFLKHGLLAGSTG